MLARARERVVRTFRRPPEDGYVAQAQAQSTAPRYRYPRLIGAGFALFFATLAFALEVDTIARYHLEQAVEASRKPALERGTCVSFATRKRIDDLYDEGRRYHPTLFGGDFFEENLDSCGKREHATAQLALAHVHTLHWLAQQPMAQGPGATAIYNSARAGRAAMLGIDASVRESELVHALLTIAARSDVPNDCEDVYAGLEVSDPINLALPTANRVPRVECSATAPLTLPDDVALAAAG